MANTTIQGVTKSNADWAKYIRSLFMRSNRRASPVMLALPNSKNCLTFQEAESIATNGEDKELEQYWNAVKATIPTVYPTKFEDFNYCYDDQLKLQNAVMKGEGFHYINEAHYDVLGDLIVDYIQRQMVEKYNMKELTTPIDPKKDEKCGNIFVSDNYLTADTLYLIIQGSGAVRAGQWARALCINDSLQTGSILPYIEKAQQKGWGMVVFNPNQNQHEEAKTDIDPAVFLKNSKQKVPRGAKTTIRGSESPPKHTIYVWDHVASNAAAKDIVIVAHSAGGWCTTELLKQRPEIYERLRAIAFTDSVHSVWQGDPAPLKNFISNNAVNWVTSEASLDTLVKKNGPTSCKCVSAGHTKHENTSSSAIDSVFTFLESKLPSTTTTSNSNNDNDNSNAKANIES